MTVRKSSGTRRERRIEARVEGDVGDTSFGLLSEELRKAADGEVWELPCRAENFLWAGARLEAHRYPLFGREKYSR